MSKIFIWRFAVMLVTLGVFVGLETELADLLNDPKFPGEATGTAIVMLILFVVYLKLLTDLISSWRKQCGKS